MHKRDTAMFKRRQLLLRCPTTKDDEIDLGKYKATTEKLKEVRDILSNPKCTIQSLTLR